MGGLAMVRKFQGQKALVFAGGLLLAYASMTMRTVLIVFMTAWLLPCQQLFAMNSTESSEEASITIQARIDGKSQLHLQGNSARWFHLDFAAPGRHQGIDPTIINDVEWFPTWPDIPDAENRDCECFSDTFEGVDPSINGGLNFELEHIRVRESASIVEFPSLENDQTLIIEFNDNGPGGSDDYIVKVTFDENFQINAGLNDAWFNPATAGQGFFFVVFPDIELFFLSWFTYDVERPDESIEAILGEPGHRWVTAFGAWAGDTVTLDVELTSGGIFDSAEPPVEQESNYGTITIVFHDCNNATLTYDFPTLGLSGSIELTRVTEDNVALCEALAAQ